MEGRTGYKVHTDNMSHKTGSQGVSCFPFSFEFLKSPVAVTKSLTEIKQSTASLLKGSPTHVYQKGHPNRMPSLGSSDRQKCEHHIVAALLMLHKRNFLTEVAKSEL